MEIITITGIDRVGKTTAVEMVNKLTNYRHFVIERDPSTVKFFCELMGRPFDEWEYKKTLWKVNALHGLHVLLICGIATLKKRFKDTNEPPLPGKLTLREHQDRLAHLFQEAQYTNSLIISTDDKPPEAVGKLIVNKLNSLINK